LQVLDDKSLVISKPGATDVEGKQFTFTTVLDMNCTQEDVYETSVKPTVLSVLDVWS